ncbi:MAG: D-alanyl-D-alanine carboxypeptidase [Firmicutes bacterium]|nr:D-alanyl-D-alanine carboxypeptidase [Bacillota bacterium]
MDKYERERYERRKARLEKKKRENRRRVLIMLSVILVLAGVLFFLLNRRQTKVFFGEETKMMCQIPVQYSLIEERTVDQTLVQQLIQDYYDRQLNSRFKVGSAYITDDAGHVLFELNAHERTYPASTTKLMTTILALEHTQDLDAWIEVQDLYGCYDDPDSMLLYIQEGDRITMRDLLYALLTESYNDCACAIAMEVSGSIEAFADLMNHRAKELGMNDSHFSNPHGLYEDEHYISAYDLNLLVRQAYTMQVFRELEQTYNRTITIDRDGDIIEIEIDNSSFFLNKDYDVPTLHFEGGKTGYIEENHSSYASVFKSESGQIVYCAILSSVDGPYMTNLILDYLYAPDAMKDLLEIDPYLAVWYDLWDY